MSIFIIVFILLFAIHHITAIYRDSKKNRLIETILCFIVLWLVQGLRHESIGIDSREAYLPFFDMIEGDSLFDFKESYFAFEPGFVFLSKLIRSVISSNPQIYILTCSFISIAPLAYLFYKYSSNISFSFLVFATLILYHFGFSGIRQAIAIAITCISFEFIIRKKLLLFLGMIFLASTIHTSALFFMVTYPVYWFLKLDRQKLFIMLIIFALFLTILRPITEIVMNIFFVHDAYLNKLNNSMDSPSYNMIIIFIAVFLFTYMGNNSQKLQQYRSLLFMTIILQSLALITATGARMALYYIPYVCLTIPLALDGYRGKSRTVLSLGISGFLIFFFFFVNGKGYLDVIPYKFFWES